MMMYHEQIYITDCSEKETRKKRSSDRCWKSRPRQAQHCCKWRLHARECVVTDSWLWPLVRSYDETGLDRTGRNM